MIFEERKLGCSEDVDRRAYGSDLANPFAETMSGRTVHAEEAHAAEETSWTCPGCKGRLSLKRSVHGRPFFSHRRRSCGSGLETALHAYAKQVICDARTVLLPEYRVDGEVTSEKAMVSFDQALMETADDRARAVRMLPDCILRTKDRTLYVEIMVTHAVDDRKELRALAANTSMIEITLSRQMASEMTVEALRTYILSGAKRTWVVNAAHEEHRNRLERRRRRAAKLATERVAEIVREYRTDSCPDDLLRKPRFLIRKWRLENLTGVVNPYPHWFRYSASVWQTLYLGEMLFDSPDTTRSPMPGETFKLRWFNFRYLGDDSIPLGPSNDGPFGGLALNNQSVPHWFNSQLIAEVEKARAEYGSGPAGLGNPTRALLHYQRVLADNGILNVADDGRYWIEQTLLGRIWRDQRLRRLLWSCIGSYSDDFKRTAISRWVSSIPPGYQATPLELAKEGGEDWARLESALVAIAQLQTARSPKPVDDLLGLPVFKANERAKARAQQQRSEFPAHRFQFQRPPR